MMPIGLATTSALAYGLSDYLGGLASRRSRALRVICVAYPISIVLVGIVAVVAGGHVSVVGLAWGLASGIAGGFAVWTFYAALTLGPMSVISPVTAVIAAALPLGVGLALGERPGAGALTGALLAVVATVLVSLEGEAEPAPRGADGHRLRLTGRVWALTLAAGVTFALFFILLGMVPDGEGLWPVAASRVGATLLMVAVAVRLRERVGPTWRLLAVGAAIAVCDAVANIAFYAATQMAMLSLVAVVAALYPAVTVLLSFVHGGERLRGVQLLGLVVGAAAVVLITLR